MTAEQMKTEFIKRYGGDKTDVRVFSAAGRVNLIGEHIDYCGGPVLPAALNLRCVVGARKRPGGKIYLKATTIGDEVELDINRLNDYRKLNWGAYQAGVAWVMQQEGFGIEGCELLYDADVPFGSGLSSSAAIEVATAKTLAAFSEEAGGKAADNVKLAVMSQRAENEYAGVNCGIMDQFASACGKKHFAIFLNCNTLDYKYVPLNLKEYGLVIANSNKKRSLQESKYNERRAECESAYSVLKEKLPQISCLADVTPQQFEEFKSLLQGKLRDRAEHVVYECDRVIRAAEALRLAEVETFGELLNGSHFSLQNLYEVTGKELDCLTEAARSHPACLGSRMTGAGFGGCTVSLVHKDGTDDFIKTVGEIYEREIGYKADFYNTTIENGAQELYE